jgi:RNA polymerase sigma factor (TIGR02999 family)
VLTVGPLDDRKLRFFAQYGSLIPIERLHLDRNLWLLRTRRVLHPGITMTRSKSPDTLIALMRRWGQGDASALDDLMPLMYSELKSLVARETSLQRSPKNIKTIGQVNAAYKRIVGEQPPIDLKREHLATIAAQATRRILVDFAQRQSEFKARPFNSRRTAMAQASGALDVDVVKLDLALNRLAKINARQASVVELRYFGGLGVKDIASVLGISDEAVVRAWRLAQAWLQVELRSNA